MRSVKFLLQNKSLVIWPALYHRTDLLLQIIYLSTGLTIIKAMAFGAPTNFLGALESSLLYCYSLTCNGVGALNCPFKIALNGCPSKSVFRGLPQYFGSIYPNHHHQKKRKEKKKNKKNKPPKFALACRLVSIMVGMYIHTFKVSPVWHVLFA